MASEKLTKEAYKIADNIEQVNVNYVKTLAKQVDDMVKAEPLNVAEQREFANINMRNIKKEMEKACNISAKETKKLLSKEAQATYKEMRKYYKHKRVLQMPFNKNKKVLNELRAINKITDGAFKNISRTAVMDKQYQRCIDRAVMAITSGSETYEEAIDRAVRQAVKNGNKVKSTGRYKKNGKWMKAKGRERRLDTAVRMNVLDGVRQVQMEVARVTAEEFGADGMEIDAHDLCAEDHIEIQGWRGTMEEYDALNADLERPIGELNCQHEAIPIVLASPPRYTEEELEEMKANSQEEIDGKSRYDWSQEMRKIETDVRECKEQLIQAEIRNRPDEIRRYNNKIKRNNQKYDKIAKKTKITPRKNRMELKY